ncbi:MAG: SDR family oxidoreductase [Gemmataceae bacterium]|nr:SDR family oxidoreductase [Gemmataceae bacterium]
MRLDGKVGIVTGAGMGMGEAVARRWAREGAAVVVADVNDEAGDRTVAAIKESGGRAVFVHADVSSEADWATITGRALSEFGGLHILHNNAGIHLWIDPLKDPIALWDRMMAINLKGVFLGCRAAIPHMIAAGGGAIVNTSSTSGLHGVPLQGVYGATKAGVLMLTRSLAKQYGPQNVRVNAICPGPIDTPMLHQAAREMADIRERSDSGALPQGSVTALGRMGTPDEIANAVTFLVSDEASFITGTWLPVDGGMTA